MDNMSLIFILYLLLAPVTRNTLALQTTISYEKQSDLDELRISDDRQRGPIDYYDATTDDPFVARTHEQISNYIGKLLVPLTPDPIVSRPNVDKTRGQIFNHTRTPHQRQKIASSTSNAFRPFNGGCRWLTLRDFKRVSLDMSELIICNGRGRSCYSLTMQAFIRWTEDDYIPLNNFKAYSNAGGVVLEKPHDGISARPSTNCLSTKPAHNGTVTGLNSRSSSWKANFREELVIFVDCGYLILQLVTDGSFLTLEAISFYQRADIASQIDMAEGDPRDALPVVPSRRPEHLVFTSKGSKNYPLFTIPLTSRYVCRNRIELVANNSIQLVLDRFELQRLSYLSAMDRNAVIDSGPDGSPPNSLIANEVRGAKLRNIKISTERSTDALDTVTRCRDPVHPSMPLTNMMDRDDFNGKQPPREIVANRWASLKSGAAIADSSAWFAQELVGKDAAVLVYFLTFGFARRLWTQVVEFKI